MKLVEKWKESKEKQKAKDIEQCRKHPMGWKIMIGAFIFAFALLAIFMIFGGAYPLAIIALIFTIWLVREQIKIYRDAFPKKVIA